MRTDQAPVIAVDGPGGSGKGTIGRRVALRLGWHFLDSGALYRLLACAAMRRQVSLDDEPSLAELAKGLDVKFETHESEERIFLGNEEVTSEIRSEECGNAASRVARFQAVRKALLQRQRDFRQAPGLVADGRDMGSVVFPDAPLKIFLTASAEERAARRHKQLKEKGVDANLRQILADIKERDERDASRSVSPLAPAPDALVVDTTNLGIGEVEDLILREVGKRLGA